MARDSQTEPESAKADVRVVSTGEELALRAADLWIRAAREAVQNKGRFTVALAGGSTPRKLYSLLAQSPGSTQVDWDRVHFFWGDERHVAPDHPDSNYKMALDSLLSHLALPPGNIHRIKTEEPDAAAAAAQYDAELRSFFQPGDGGIPMFDLILLGLGPDAHTASLFPGSDALRETNRLVVAPFVKKFASFRVTITAPVINHGSRVMFLVSGADKASALRGVLEGPRDIEKLPAQIVGPMTGPAIWLCDKAAASMLSAKYTVL